MTKQSILVQTYKSSFTFQVNAAENSTNICIQVIWTVCVGICGGAFYYPPSNRRIQQ